jgi:hypothetical protein
MPSPALQEEEPASYWEERRKFQRFNDPKNQLHLVVDHRELKTINWSSGGCLVKALDHWQVGDSVAGTLETRQGVPMGAVISEVLRIDEEGRAALKFTTIAPLL